MTLKQKMVRTNEDWYPSYFETSDTGETLAMVKVSLHKLDKGYRVSVWGNDDFGLERDFSGPCESLYCYQAITSPVEKEKLLAEGFVPA